MSKERLRQAIVERFGTQAAFAKHIGWSRQKLAKWLAGDASPRIGRVNFIARAMGIPVAEAIKLLDD